MGSNGKYGGVAIALHWIIAFGIVTNVALAWIWPHLADESVRPAIDFHKSLGITLLGFAIMRLLWRLTHRPPPMPPGYQRWEIGLSHATHWTLYLLIFAMPLSGWIMDSAWKDAATHPMYLFSGFEWPRIGWVMALPPETKEHMHDLFGATHIWASYLLYALFFLHVAGALKHQFFDGERELQRMLPGG